MKILKLVTVTIIAAMIFSTVTPAYAKKGKKVLNDDLVPAESLTLNFTINNKSGIPVSIWLIGKKGNNNYFFSADPGPSHFHVKSDNYRFVAKSPCGDKSGKIQIQGGNNHWKWTCPNGYTQKPAKVKKSGGGTGKKSDESSPNLVKLTINNTTSSTISLYIENNKHSYLFYAAPGTSDLKVAAGSYKYTAHSACGLQKGSKNLNNAYFWRFWCSRN
jgi:hypothetical protein